MKRVAAFAAALAGVLLAGTPPPAGQAGAGAASDPREGTVGIRVIVEGVAVLGRLDSNAAARDFASLLPATLALRDHARTERIADLPRKLSTDGAPPGYDPSVGDIASYAPWGNPAIFYEEFRYSPGLIRLGIPEGGIDALRGADPTRVTVERAE